jgi:LysR family transcriptional regulator, transcription activator of glutamate synthase operon
MELRQLKYFLAIAECGSMSSAAESLHVSQPSLSVSLRNLETELGVQLFNRRGRTLELNDDGRYFVDRVRMIEAILIESVTSIGGDDDDRERTVNCIHEMPLGNIGALVSAFRKRNPGFRVRLGFSGSTLFLRTSVDVEIVSTLNRISDDSYIYLGSDQPIVALPPDHRMAKESGVCLTDLKYDDFVVVGSHGKEKQDGSGSLDGRTLHYLLCAQKGIAPPVVSEVQWFHEALELVEKGQLCCLGFDLSWFMGSNYDLVIKPLLDVSMTRNMYIHFLSAGKPSAAAWAFADFLQDYLDAAPQYLADHYGYQRNDAFSDNPEERESE